MSIEAREYRQTIGLFATGVTIVTSGSGADLRAMTANAVTSLSLDPILLIVCIKKYAHIIKAIDTHNTLTVNILQNDQADLATYFAGGWKKPAPPPFEFISWEGSDRLGGCLAALGCSVYKKLDGGDHWIILGEVFELYRAENINDPLIFYHGQYQQLSAEQEV